MNEASEQPKPEGPLESSPGFKNYKEALKALRALQSPISDQLKTNYMNRLRASSSARYMAFRLLALRAVGEMQAKLTPFIASLEEILHADVGLLDLRECESVEAVEKSVLERFGQLRDKNDLERFTNARFHLPLLYGLILVWDDAARFQAGLNALASAIDRLSQPKRSAKHKPSNSLEILARALVTHVPEKPLFGKALTEMLNICQALFRQAEETNRENLGLRSELAQAKNEIESLRLNLEEGFEAKAELQSKVVSLAADVARLQAELEREKQDFEALKSHGEQDRDRAVADAIARLRSEVSRRTENIRLFADREQPNRQGILNLVAEIAQALAAEGVQQ